MKSSNLTNDDKRFLKKLGAKIRSVRMEKGWSLEETEEYGWNNWQHLQKIESGKNITVVTLRKVAQLYKLSVSQITEGI